MHHVGLVQFPAEEGPVLDTNNHYVKLSDKIDGGQGSGHFIIYLYRCKYRA